MPKWKLLLPVGLALGILACARVPEPPLRVRMEEGDRQRDWGVIYFQSWRQAHQGDYLVLARRLTADAVRRYFDVQVRMGHSYPDFYTIDRRRVESCLFLKEMEREAARYQVRLDETVRVGCFD